MALLQVRNFPDDMYEKISSLAKNNHRTISGEATNLIEKGLNEKHSNYSRRKEALLRSARINVSEEFRNFDFVTAIREDRER